MSGSSSLARFPAFGGTAVVVVSDAGQLQNARDAVEQMVAAFDLACSRFREDSELSALNRARGSSVEVSPLLLEAVTASLRAARLTGGDVDPTVGGALVALGYDRDFASMSVGDAVEEMPPGVRAGRGASVSFATVPGWRTIEIDPEARTIRLARGVRLDLGATAKALAADRAAAAARGAADCGVLVSFGGDIALAGPPPAEGWRVRVTDDHRSGVEAPGQWIAMQSGGLATSSTTVRRWQTGGTTVHHLLDPVRRRPAAALWRTVSVAAATCLDANIASTAAIIRGDRAASWLTSLRLPSRLVSEQGTSLHLAGWPDVGDDLAPCGDDLAPGGDDLAPGGDDLALCGTDLAPCPAALDAPA